MKPRFNRLRRRGFAAADPVLAFLHGYDRIRAAERDGMWLYIEIRDVSNALFPLREVPVPNRPGYFTHRRDYFHINCPDPTLQGDMREYFLAEHSRFRNNLYGQLDHLGDFLQSVVHLLVSIGESYYAISWDDVDIHGRKYKLPVDFSYLRPETMRVQRRADVIRGFRLQHSLYTYIKESAFKGCDGSTLPRTVDFDADEVFFCRYPFARSSPSARSLRYLKTIDRFWRFGIDQSRSAVEVENPLLPLEKARYTTFAKEKRKYDLARAKIRTAFSYLMDVNGPNMTRYYDLYTVIRHKQFLNDLRDYLVGEFNKQVMASIAQKNMINHTLTVSYDGFIRNEELRTAMEQFRDGQLSFKEVVNSYIK